MYPKFGFLESHLKYKKKEAHSGNTNIQLLIIVWSYPSSFLKRSWYKKHFQGHAFLFIKIALTLVWSCRECYKQKRLGTRQNANIF